MSSEIFFTFSRTFGATRSEIGCDRFCRPIMDYTNTQKTLVSTYNKKIQKIQKYTMAFLDGYTDVPQNSGSSGGKYMKLTQGANQFRIVGSFEDGTNIQGMLGWGEDEEGKRKTFPLEGRRGSSTQVCGEPKAVLCIARMELR